MAEYVQIPDDWNAELQRLWESTSRYVHVRDYVESWPRVQVPTVEQIAMVLAGVRATADWEVFLSQWGEDAATYLEQAERGRGKAMRRDALSEHRMRSWHVGCRAFSHRLSPWRLWHRFWQHWHGWQAKRKGWTSDD